MRSVPLFILTVAAFAALGGTASADGGKPMRHLVYDFDVTFSSSVSQQSYSGTTNSSANSGDRGTITVDVLAVQPDSGIVVQISEQARNTRSAQPAMCVTYGTGQNVCDQTKKINEEEYTLLRLLGKDLVNPAVIDAHKSWTYDTTSSDTSEHNVYHIDTDNGSGMLGISILRTLTVTGAQGYTATTNGKLSYNEKLNVPVSDTEDTLTRYDGVQSYNRLEQQVTLTLANDSLAQATAPAH